MISAKKKQEASSEKKIDRSYSIWYEVVMAIELLLYGGLAVFVVAKVFPADYATFAGIVFAGFLGYVLWRKNMELIDFLIKIPLWIHWIAITILTCLFITGRLLISCFVPSNSVNGTQR